MNGSLKSRDRSLVIGGEMQDVVAVGDGPLLQHPEGPLISGHGGELDTQEVVEPLDHVVAKAHSMPVLFAAVARRLFPVAFSVHLFNRRA